MVSIYTNEMMLYGGGGLGRISRFFLMEGLRGEIIDFVEKSKQRVFTKAEVGGLLEGCKREFGLPNRVSLKEFLRFLGDAGVFEGKVVGMPLGKEAVRFVGGGASVFEVALSLRGGAYLSHYSALFLHGLTTNVPKVIYTSVELKKNRSTTSKKMEQKDVDRAFGCRMRRSKQVARYGDVEIFLLNGKNVGLFGVREFEWEGAGLRVTDLERTLIDAAVRPGYAGGPIEVLKAYEAARERVSVNRLLATLRRLDYAYPYHQAVGFYLERAGYRESLLALVEGMGIEYDFYLSYRIESKRYSERWRLFYPEGM